MTPEVLAAFGRCRQAPESDEAHVAALVACLLDPAVDTVRVNDDLDVLARACPAQIMPWRYLASEGFQGNATDYQSLDNSNLARVLGTRRGIPISLGVVLIRVARTAGHLATGINFPGHFLVRVDDVLVDPFVMQQTDADRLIDGLPAASRRLPPHQLFSEASPVAVGLRMLNNIKLAYIHQAAWHQMLDVVDAQLALAPEQPALHVERGDLWVRLGAIAAARESWEKALEIAESSGSDEAEAVRHAVAARRRDVGGAGEDTVH